MDELMIHISLMFGLVVLLCAFTFYKATHDSCIYAWVVTGWIVLQSAVSVSGFYQHTEGPFPRIILVAVPPMAVLAGLFFTSRGRTFVDTLDTHLLTVIHVVRGPVELVLYWLFLCRLVPHEITLGGGNLDIFSGLTTLLVYYWGVLKEKLHWQVQAGWHIVCTGLLLHVYFKLLFSAPSCFQITGYEYPNVAILRFPFVFLPGLVVPLLLCSHIVLLRSLLKVHSIIRPRAVKSLVQTDIS
ncbi:hypothetical protein [Dyadobacter sandarakinus]|uniref:Integral membrane protein n=1 Tax=Dyadobacter sandarakinus TaxID=2747268 RepID=A0ABX7I8L3_9BACT|nr:hypothetical protein [Dyadobacter sandarakinus]QRR02168.1 hypothetical protein HWI92_15270 [Dyadobacter sandarakinus]